VFASGRQPGEVRPTESYGGLSEKQDQGGIVISSLQLPASGWNKKRKKKRTAAESLGYISGRWTKPEHDMFMHAVAEFGKNWTKV
jgi:hypothetical protein